MEDSASEAHESHFPGQFACDVHAKYFWDGPLDEMKQQEKTSEDELLLASPFVPETGKVSDAEAPAYGSIVRCVGGVSN